MTNKNTILKELSKELCKQYSVSELVAINNSEAIMLLTKKHPYLTTSMIHNAINDAIEMKFKEEATKYGEFVTPEPAPVIKRH